MWPPPCSTSSWEGAITGKTVPWTGAGATAWQISWMAQAQGSVSRGNLGLLVDA